MFDPLHDDEWAHGRSSDSERNIKIEKLLLSGLDHYFKGRHERAIDVWTRILFLEKSHARARAYIDRARAALAERLRESEELLYSGVAAFERGDVTEARSLLSSAVERGGGRDEALTMLERLNRLEVASGDNVAPSRETPLSFPAGRQCEAGPTVPARRLAVMPMVLFVSAIVGVGYLAISEGQWKTLLLERTVPQTLMPGSDAAETLRVPSGAEVKLARARRLADDGRFYDALSELDSIAFGYQVTSEIDTLRTTIQHRLFSASGALLSEPLGPGGAKP